MRLRPILVHLATIVAGSAAACGGATEQSNGTSSSSGSSSSSGGSSGTGGNTSSSGMPAPPPPTGIPGCNGAVDPASAELTAAQACALFAGPTGSYGSTVFGCSACKGNTCVFPDDVAQAIHDAQDAGAGDGGTCPSLAEPITVTCRRDCTGRGTAGIAEQGLDRGTLGEYFAWCARLEAAAILSFRRLGAELRHHGAPDALVRAAELAADEEVRHTAIMEALAQEHGAVVERPEAPALAPRSLLDVALENAVEGCIRETYGAALGVLRATRATAPEVRAALLEIATDECGHAETSWAVWEWSMAQLDAASRTLVLAAMRDALAAVERDLAEEDDAPSPALGMPTRAEKATLFALVAREIVLPAAA